jgi:uncharacterized Ntn-hydrolase superfamily protein
MRTEKILQLLLMLLLMTGGIHARQSLNGIKDAGKHDNVVATYSIVGWDSVTGDFGVAVQSKFFGVGSVVPYAKAGVGAIATQAFANTTFGPAGLDLLDKGLGAQQVVETLIKSDTGASQRQLGIVDAQGNSYAFTGSACNPYAGQMTGRGYSVQGNILAGEGVVKAMGHTFELTSGDLAERLLAALDAGEKAGGDKRGRQSAALLVVRDKAGYGGFNDRMIDLRVDDDSMPLLQLRRLYKIWLQTFFSDAQTRSIEMFNGKRNFAAAEELTKRMVTNLNAQLRDRPDDPDMLNSVAWALTTNNIDRARALELAKRAIKLAPAKLNILDTLAECHYELGHFDEAIAIESELVSKEPANDYYWKQLQRFKEGKQKSGQ